MEKPGTPTNSQQFCLRWHNHQASLLGSLPGLLDQSHLTDVTLSAEGRTIKAHKIILSACSTFFAELFKNLDAAPHQHPVIILPGTSFPSICSLLTFMYAGEVNVFEEQISNLLQLAETLGIKGLADFNNGVSTDKSSHKSDESQSPPPKSSPSPTPLKQQPSPLETFFSRSLNLFPYPPIPEPLNYSRNHDLLSRLTQTASNLKLQATPKISNVDENANIDNERNKSPFDKRNSNMSKPELKRIDKIAETLRSATGKNFFDFSPVVSKQNHMIPHSPPASMTLKPPSYPPVSSFPASHFMSDETRTPENIIFDSQPSMMNENMCGAVDSLMEKPALPKSANPKLYATCFICNKKLSNQYNLRVHLETHQNMRYACQVCNHVSRSKDALRKHVSYRHPGTSTCDPDSRRKRSRLNPVPIPLTPGAQASMLLTQANLFGSILNTSEAQQMFNKQQSELHLAGAPKELITTPQMSGPPTMLRPPQTPPIKEEKLVPMETTPSEATQST